MCASSGQEEEEEEEEEERRSYTATVVDVQVDPQRHRFGRSQTDFAVQAVAECQRKHSESQCIALAFRWRQ